MYTIYSKPNCSACMQAKQLLEMEELPFEYKQLGAHYNLNELMLLLVVQLAHQLVLVVVLFDQQAVLYRDWETDRKSTRLNSSHSAKSRMPSSA